MALTRADETDLLLPLHEGLHEAQPWATFLGRLRQRVRADAVELVIAPDGQAAERRIAVPPGAAVADDRMWRAGLRPGRAYSVEHGPGFGQVVRVDEPGGAAAWLAIRRATRDFSAADAALLARLAPHLAIALRTRVALDQAGMDAELSEAALRRAGVGWVGVDADGRVLALSDGAAEVLGARWAGVGLGGGDVAAALDGATARLVRVRDPGAWMLLVSLSVTPLATPAVALIGLILVPRTGDEAGRVAVLGDLFGLPPSEARLAAALAAGASLTEAAGQLGLTIETARNYSKRVFAKMRARGQPDVVRLIGASLARLV
ncbi:hypothetical protein [Sphingomonas dokdonensis]|uniref:HTH luxR-type domain-containing protein n=1 Tax=Sphingomonas dokdonensis TaxID=344880 RepID=A0A245ZKX0_9SPHN|nr:hypothetical protein [Sphingomonas dokdonensis]OWK30379.1 hypothetical protein SPDO_20640 [Sphingomonas dokdonensis]